MTSPAERFSASKRRAADAQSVFGQWSGQFPFELDDFQVQACRSLEAGRGVLVAAPTGSGKTVVGEFALHLALQRGGRAFYTTPIKALSNQKYRDLCERYDRDTVGLLTGDTVINGDAPIVVMTTEVVRNMLYDGSPAIGMLSHLVMDEVHYLADRQRGAVWEEVILHLPEQVRIAALSATVSNAEEFGAWLADVRGDTDVIVEERRPIPLHQHVLAGRSLVDLFAGDTEGVNPVLIRMAQDDARAARIGRGGRGSGRSDFRGGYQSRSSMLDRLAAAGLLPALVFVFSRRGCDEALVQCMRSGVRLTDDGERRRIRSHVDERCADLPRTDLAVLGYYEWRDALERGVAAHHAGMLPLFKEVVEELFTEGLTKAVFATETLALGINMPARSVVLERLVKWNGQTHADITAGEYTQLTGRAGRRGIDVEGHAITVWHHGLDPNALAGLASTRTYPLKSSFQPSYNMAVNLVGRLGKQEARDLLETSFAQYQADAGVVGLANQIRRHEHALEGYREAMTCHLGDFAQYASLRSQLSERERAISRDSAARRRQQVEQQLAALRVGDIVVVGVGRRSSPGLVVEQSAAAGQEARTSVLTLDRRVRRLTATDVPHGVDSVGRMKVPRGFDARSANWRRDLARTLDERSRGLDLKRARKSGQSSPDDDGDIAALRAQLRAHPCHGCTDREAHARWGERYHKLEKETAALRRKIEARTSTVARQFDRVCALLTDLGYLETVGQELVVADAGRTLARLYCDQDLVAAECLQSEIWQGLSPAELAGACAALVYESRLPEDGSYPPMPHSPALRAAVADQESIAAELAERESGHRLGYVRSPNPGFCQAAWMWAVGEDLDVVLRECEMAPGDFVRWSRQLIDLLSQIGEAAADQPDLSSNARRAADAMRHGVISYTGVV
ncbi:MAG: DEAD/DEAH box helicase [Actinomycetes bacterium]